MTTDGAADPMDAYPVSAPWPADMQFGLSNTCNFHCVFCSEHRPGNRITPRRFTREMIREMLSILPHIKEAAFHENSEFFLDTNFEQILDVCSRNGLTLSLNTNGAHLPDSHCKALEQYRGHLNVAVSLDAATAGTYARLRGHDLDSVLENVETLIRIVRSKPGYRSRQWCPTHTTAAFIIMGENKDEALAFLEMAHRMGFDRISYYRLHDSGDWIVRRNGFNFDYREQGSWQFKAEYNQLIRQLDEAARKKGILSWLPEPYPLDDGHVSPSEHITTCHRAEPLPEPGKAPICTKPWTGRVVINAFGGIHPCCHNWDVIGNIKKHGFQRAWNSPKARAFRKALVMHRFPKTCRNGSCPVYRTWLLQKKEAP